MILFNVFELTISIQNSLDIYEKLSKKLKEYTYILLSLVFNPTSKIKEHKGENVFFCILFSILYEESAFDKSSLN